MLELSVHLHTTACPHLRAPGAPWPGCAKLIQPDDQSNVGNNNMPDNGYVESFNGRMRDELLNETIFYDLDHARSVIAGWVARYNQRRPHSALGYLTPAAYAATLTATGDRLRNPDQLRRSPVAPSVQLHQSQPGTLASSG